MMQSNTPPPVLRPGRRPYRSILMALGFLLFLSCGPPTSDTWNRSYEVTGPLEAGNRLVYLNKTLEQILVLEPNRDGGSVGADVRKAPTGNEPARLARSPDGDRAFVVDRGDEQLGVYDLTADPPSRQTVELETEYDRISVGPRGEFVLLSFTEDPKGCVACNPQEVGIVDLRDGVPETSHHLVLSERVTDFVFAPTFTLGDTEQRLVAALAPSRVMLVDLEVVTSGDGREADETRNVDLTVSQADPVRHPKDATFHVASGKEAGYAVALYVSTEGGNDVTQITIGANPRDDRKLSLSLNQLAAEQSPPALAVLDLQDVGTRLLTLDNQTPRFRLVDVRRGEGNSFELPMSSAPTDLIVYETLVTTESEQREEIRVLVWSRQSPIVAVVRPRSLATSAEQPTAGRNVRAIRLETSPQTVEMEARDERKRAIAVHPGTKSGFSVLKLREDENEAIPIQGESLADVEFAGETAWGVFRQSPNLGRFELESGHPTDYPLPYPGKSLLFDGDDNLVVVDHDKERGEFTVMDADDPDPDNSRVLQGVFVQGLFDESVPESN